MPSRSRVSIRIFHWEARRFNQSVRLRDFHFKGGPAVLIRNPVPAPLRLLFTFRTATGILYASSATRRSAPGAGVSVRFFHQSYAARVPRHDAGQLRLRKSPDSLGPGLLRPGPHPAHSADSTLRSRAETLQRPHRHHDSDRHVCHDDHGVQLRAHGGRLPVGGIGLHLRGQGHEPAPRLPHRMGHAARLHPAALAEHHLDRRAPSTAAIFLKCPTPSPPCWWRPL